MYRLLNVLGSIVNVPCCSPSREGRDGIYDKNETKSKTTKESEPSFVAILSIKIKNCRANPGTTMLNFKAVHITHFPHQ